MDPGSSSGVKNEAALSLTESRPSWQANPTAVAVNVLHMQFVWIVPRLVAFEYHFAVFEHHHGMEFVGAMAPYIIKYPVECFSAGILCVGKMLSASAGCERGRADEGEE